MFDVGQKVTVADPQIFRLDWSYNPKYGGLGSPVPFFSSFSQEVNFPVFVRGLRGESLQIFTNEPIFLQARVGVQATGRRVNERYVPFTFLCGQSPNITIPTREIYTTPEGYAWFSRPVPLNARNILALELGEPGRAAGNFDTRLHSVAAWSERLDSYQQVTIPEDTRFGFLSVQFEVAPNEIQKRTTPKLDKDVLLYGCVSSALEGAAFDTQQNPNFTLAIYESASVEFVGRNQKWSKVPVPLFAFAAAPQNTTNLPLFYPKPVLLRKSEQLQIEYSFGAGDGLEVQNSPNGRFISWFFQTV